MAIYEPFESTCLVLGLVYFLLGLVCVIQIARIRRRDSFMMLSVWPATVQEQVHLILSFFSIFRVIFFCVAIDAWNSYEGEVVSEKVLFYSMDEFSTVRRMLCVAVVVVKSLIQVF